MDYRHFPPLVQHVSDALVLPGPYCRFLRERQPGRAAHTCLGSYPLHSSAFLSVLCDYRQAAVIFTWTQVFGHIKHINRCSKLIAYMNLIRRYVNLIRRCYAIDFEHPINKKTALLLIWQFSQTLFIIMQSFESKRFL